LKGLAASNQVEITQAGKKLLKDKGFGSSPRDGDAAILYPNGIVTREGHDTRRLTSNKLPVNLGENPRNTISGHGSSGALYLHGIPPEAVKDRKRLKEYQGQKFD
jgi:hypothetical protein